MIPKARASRLLRQLHDAMEKSALRNSFVPINKIEDLLKPESIAAVLDQYGIHNQETRDVIVEKAKRIVAILLDIKWMDVLVPLIEGGLRDIHLPLDRKGKSFEGSNDDLDIHSIVSNRFLEDPDSLINMLHDFYEKQFLYVAPVWDGSKTYSVYDETPIPIVEMSEAAIAHGGFGEIFKGRIHWAHQVGLYAEKDTEHPNVAIKKVASFESYGQEHEPFNEIKKVKEHRSVSNICTCSAGSDENSGYNSDDDDHCLGHGHDCSLNSEHDQNGSGKNNRYAHRHLINFVAHFNQGGSYYIVTDWADGGNLREFWENNSPGMFRNNAIKWAIGQMHGITETVHVLHNIGKEYPSSNVRMNLRHGDLKPENIVLSSTRRFFDRNTNSWRPPPRPATGSVQVPKRPGTLIITDMGLCRINSTDTHLRHSTPRAHIGTRTYMPPEAYGGAERPRSRADDMWALGCIMLEFVVWLVYGKSRLSVFYDETKVLKKGTYYQMNGNSANLRPKVKEWIKKMQDGPLSLDDSKCISPALREILEFAENRLLVANTLRNDGNIDRSRLHVQGPLHGGLAVPDQQPRNHTSLSTLPSYGNTFDVRRDRDWVPTHAANGDESTNAPAGNVIPIVTVNNKRPDQILQTTHRTPNGPAAKQNDGARADSNATVQKFREIWKKTKDKENPGYCYRPSNTGSADLRYMQQGQSATVNIQANTQAGFF